MLKLPRTCGLVARPFPKHPPRPSRLSRRHSPSAMAQQVQVSTAELREKFGIDGCVDVVEGEGGLPKIVMTHACGAAAEVYLYGACVTSWKQSSGDEILFIRPDTVYDKSKPIAGGIPICFPQFGPGELPQHGFARNMDWQLVSTSGDPQPDERDPQIELMLEDTAETREMFPNLFRVVYTVTLHGEQLKTAFRVINTGGRVITFTGALHGYFEVKHVSDAKVKGLQGLKTLDKVPNPENPVEGVMEDEVLVFRSEVDKIFLNAPDFVELDVGIGATVALSSNNWKDVVCWNPWTSKPEFYEKFVCVENASYTTQTVQPGESWLAETSYSVSNT